MNKVPRLFRFGHVRGEFQALRFAARQRRQRLAQTNVFQTDRAERIKRIEDFLGVFKELQRFGDGQVEDLADIFAAISDFQDLFTESAAMALRARRVNIGEKLHLDFFIAFAAAGFAAPAFDVERKSRRRVAAQAR